MSVNERRFPFRELALSWVWALLIFLFSASVALAFNSLRSNGLPLFRRAPFDLYTDCPELSGELPVISVAKLPVGASKVVYMDARMALPHIMERIPGALFMPMYPIDLPDFSPLKTLPKGTWIVVYGSDKLSSNKRLVTALMGQTVRGVYLLEGGLGAWKAAGRPTVKTRIPMAKVADIHPGEVLFVDARDEDAALREQISGALNVPFDTTLPPEAKTLEKLKLSALQIIVYDGGESKNGSPSLALGVAADLMARGCAKVAVMEGGVIAWKAAGKTLVPGKGGDQ
ncbi:hypothetical protein KKF84_15535 [Myxococcota bacterium]|nr:hypothetical protein [Myxococcota bacterium]MBU1536736.1 hypothetical protein [Myxococcota bacterium]